LGGKCSGKFGKRQAFLEGWGLGPYEEKERSSPKKLGRCFLDKGGGCYSNGVLGAGSRGSGLM